METLYILDGLIFCIEANNIININMVWEKVIRHHVIQLINHIAQENDKPSSNFTLATFLDLSKAFDTWSAITKMYYIN